MITTVQKWGNSLGLRIPKAYAAEVQLASGAAVEVAVRNGDIVIRPIRRPAYRLSELLAKVKKSNLHDEVPTGPSVGREAW